MSRHRHIRHMVDEFYDEEEYDEMEEDEILESDDDIDDEAIAEVMQSVPNIDLQEAKNSLKRYNGDVSRAVADFKASQLKGKKIANLKLKSLKSIGKSPEPQVSKGPVKLNLSSSFVGKPPLANTHPIVSNDTSLMRSSVPLNELIKHMSNDLSLSDRSPVDISELANFPKEHRKQEASNHAQSNASAFGRAICLSDGDGDDDSLDEQQNLSANFSKIINQYYLDDRYPIKPYDFNDPSPDDIVLDARDSVARGADTSHNTNVQLKQKIQDKLHNNQSSSKVFVVQSKTQKKALSHENISNSVESLNLSESSKKYSLKPSKKLKHDVKSEYQKIASQSKGSLNLVIIGHVDAGKSTLMGRLLYELGNIDDKTMKRFQRDAQNIGKASFAYAWILDETSEERERGVTIDVAVSKFETKNRTFTLLDAPGHRDFIPNMISGASQADAAILVVDANYGEFESGFDANGQTKEHALLSRSMGVSQIIVAVNKMDKIDWSKDRYEEIVEKVSNFLLNQVGFKRKQLHFVPCSGITGENLTKHIEGKPDMWYHGQSLIEFLDALEVPRREIDRPLRMSVSTTVSQNAPGSSNSISISGKVDQGSLQLNEKILVQPASTSAIVKSISDEYTGERRNWAVAGDYVRIALAGLEESQIGIGSILSCQKIPLPVRIKFEAQVVVFDLKIPILAGANVIFHRQSMNVPSIVSRLYHTIDKNTGEILKRHPRALSKNTSALVEITVKDDRGICIDTFKDSKDFGRFTLRRKGQTIAAGIVNKLL